MRSFLVVSILALQVAVEFVNGDGRKNAAYTTEDVLKIAKEFEAYLTGQPVLGFEAKPDEPDA